MFLGVLSMTEEKKQQTPVGLPEQSELDAPAGEQDIETKYVASIELIEHDSGTCYLCGCRISAKGNTDYRCQRCGNRACSSCLELMEIPDDVCLSCDIKANRRKAIRDRIALVGIVTVVVIILYLILYLLLMAAFPQNPQTLFQSSCLFGICGQDDIAVVDVGSMHSNCSAASSGPNQDDTGQAFVF